MRVLKIAGAIVVSLLVVSVMAALLSPRDQAASPPAEEALPAVPATNTPAPDPTPTGAPRPTKEPRPTREPRTRQPQRAEGSRCEDVAPAVVAAIEEGLTVTGGGNLRGAQAVRSRDFERVWFVSADIQGDGMEGSGEIGTWATNDISANGAGVIFSADAMAEGFSDWGRPPDRFSPGQDGFNESAVCVATALQT